MSVETMSGGAPDDGAASGARCSGEGRGGAGARAAGAATAAGRQFAARLRHECFERDTTRLRLTQVRTTHVTFITSFASSKPRRRPPQDPRPTI